MTDKEKELLQYITEQANSDIADCRRRIEREQGIIEGIQMACAKIARFIRSEPEGK